jgi:hypothetical protein
MTSANASPHRELDHRSNGAVDVRLLWNPRTNQVSIAVADKRSGEAFEVAVRATEALDAFHHPFAYLANTDRRSAAQRRDHRYAGGPR